MNAIDTNVLVYFVGEHEPAKQAQATELLERLAKEETETALLWQVAVEFLSCLRRWENAGRIDRRTRRLGTMWSVSKPLSPASCRPIRSFAGH